MGTTEESDTQAADFETAVTSGDELEVRLWLRLLTCTNLMEAEVRRRLRDEFSITLARFDLLAQLERAPEGLTMGQLSRRLMVSNGNVTGLISRLVGEGLVVRQAAAHDKRTHIVRLTAKGERAFGEIVLVHKGWVNRMLGHLDHAETATLMDLLAKLKNGLPNKDAER